MMGKIDQWSTMQEFNAQQLHHYLANSEDKPFLLDVREVWEFERCAIEGSVLIPMGQVMSQLEQLDPDRTTVVICHHGIRSRVIAIQLERAGFGQVINLAGGVDAWARDIDLEMAVY